jgi:hypothetical protein
VPTKHLFLGLTVSAALTAAITAGCGASSLTSGLDSAVSSAASRAASVAASAFAEAKGAADATSDVRAAAVYADPGGRAVSQLTVSNPTAGTHDYTVSVTFDNASGDLIDTVVVSVRAVPAHSSAIATAQSDRPLNGAVIAKITAALRH